MFKDNTETKEVLEYYENSENLKSKNYVTPEGKKHGLCVGYYEDGSVASSQNFVKGTLWGRQEFFYPSGNLKETYDCLRDEKEGVYKSFYDNPENSVKEKFVYRDGLKCGLQETFFENKLPHQKEQMFLGKQLGEQKYFWGNGKIQLQYTINKEGFPDGVLERYYENGNLEVRSKFSNNERNGIQKEFYETGEIKREMIYKNNHLDGLQRHFDKDGNIINQCTYDLGKKIS